MQQSSYSRAVPGWSLLAVCCLMLLPVLTGTLGAPAVQARSDRPAGVPLLYYVVLLYSFPAIPGLNAPCTPTQCVDNPDFALTQGIGPEDCNIAGYPTREAAQQWVIDNYPPPAAWFIVQATDAAHAFASVIVQNGNAGYPVTPAEASAVEDQVAALYASVCSDQGQ